jgi:hypothetical protein
LCTRMRAEIICNAYISEGLQRLRLGLSSTYLTKQQEQNTLTARYLTSEHEHTPLILSFGFSLIHLMSDVVVLF